MRPPSARLFPLCQLDSGPVVHGRPLPALQKIAPLQRSVSLLLLSRRAPAARGPIGNGCSPAARNPPPSNPLIPLTPDAARLRRLHSDRAQPDIGPDSRTRRAEASPNR